MRVVESARMDTSFLHLTIPHTDELLAAIIADRGSSNMFALWKYEPAHLRLGNAVSDGQQIAIRLEVSITPATFGGSLLSWAWTRGTRFSPVGDVPARWSPERKSSHRAKRSTHVSHGQRQTTLSPDARDRIRVMLRQGCSYPQIIERSTASAAQIKRVRAQLDRQGEKNEPKTPRGKRPARSTCATLTFFRRSSWD